MSKELIIDNAAFELRWLGTKFGIIPENVFCTLTADRLLSPSREQIHDLKSALFRYHGIEIPKDQGASDWGAFVLTDDQIEYARNDVRYLHLHMDLLKKKIEEADSYPSSNWRAGCLPIIARMEIHGFPVSVERMDQLRASAQAEAARLLCEIRDEFRRPN